MDTLIYRIPGEKTIAQNGRFSEVLSGEPNGFVVTDFLHRQHYQFVQSVPETTSEWHLLREEPVVISPRDYQLEAHALLHAFPVMGVQKAVYSRVKSVHFPGVKARELFDELEKTYPRAFVYLISSQLFGTWIGATPETLVQSDGKVLATMALAATRSADDTSAWSQKEQEEHQFVVDAIAETLQRNQCTNIRFDAPEETIAGPVKHLRTPFEAQLTDYSAWQIAMDLHPTPAVCGTPRMAALDLLSSREMHQRLLYTGIIGINTPGKTRLYVNLRCAQLQREKLFLYLGGGYTIDSIPDMEWEETEKKAQTLLKCVQRIRK